MFWPHKIRLVKKTTKDSLPPFLSAPDTTSLKPPKKKQNLGDYALADLFEELRFILEKHAAFKQT